MWLSWTFPKRAEEDLPVGRWRHPVGVLLGHWRSYPALRKCFSLKECCLSRGPVGNLPWKNGLVQSLAFWAWGEKSTIKLPPMTQKASPKSPTSMSLSTHRPVPLALGQVSQMSHLPPRCRDLWKLQRIWSSPGLDWDKHPVPARAQLLMLLLPLTPGRERGPNTGTGGFPSL